MTAPARDPFYPCTVDTCAERARLAHLYELANGAFWRASRAIQAGHGPSVSFLGVLNTRASKASRTLHDHVTAHVREVWHL